MDTINTINKINQNYNHSCEYCGKKYTRKNSYTKHTILCEVFHKSKREKRCEKEESSDIPTTQQLYGIIQELALKYKILEEKMEGMQKWVDKKKKKLNVIQWLNTKTIPSIAYANWMEQLFAIEEHVEILIEQSMAQTVDAMLNYNFQIMSETQTQPHVHPIYCFAQKVNIFYMHDNSKKEWRQMTSEDLVILSKKIHSKILRAICNWHKKNIDKINQSDKMAILYNKTMIKLMSVQFTPDSVYLNKMKSSLFQYLKTDLTSVVEYDFEFE